MLDFDGTLAPIAKTPGRHAFLRRNTKLLLEKLSKKFDVIIISGRSLENIKNKVGLPGLIYSGSHGFEWQIGRGYGCVKIPLHINKLLSGTIKDFKKIASEYSGAMVEDKKFSVALHYRMIKKPQLKYFLKDARKIIKDATLKDLELINDKKTFEIRPALNWTKGEIADYMVKYLQKKHKKTILPVYIGDSKTDEDAFRALSSGITVRVGKKKGSQAKYYLKNQKEVNKFLEFILRIQE